MKTTFLYRSLICHNCIFGGGMSLPRPFSYLISKFGFLVIYMQVDASEALMQAIFHSEKWGTMAFVIVEILFWGIFSGFLHKKGIYIKL